MPSSWPADDPAATRPDEDDYDLMTYGEAAARLAELIKQEKLELDRLTAAAEPDDPAIGRLVARIELLEASDARYRQESATARAFVERFGFAPAENAGPAR